MIKKGVYAAGMSILRDDMSLDVDYTITHAEKIIKNGLHGVFFFGSTGQSQLVSMSEKKDLISKLAHNKLRNQFYLGTGSNSLKEVQKKCIGLNHLNQYIQNQNPTRYSFFC